MGQQAATEQARRMYELGQTTTPNVEVVRMMGVRLIQGQVPADIRKELRHAVNEGRIGHLKKDGLRPEAFFHPNSKWRALEMRDRIARESIDALRGVYATPDPERFSK